ncbi:periplasmic heavy metal sensor [Pseudotabrizicola alkalilacus]|uniref:Periplasmic heavy metal sensor n=1 Tax=Pseudotabrizicola alkalilacus TaxID=2305252 RepID=A0A411Z2D6_9RHOB|nr:periplasmic heavy metal sensor [Pseudotabrizicola alkalilacus]RGP37227.1 periplasmic heavy metal sensor [Pseudotabrizicola alkalilacus]
MTDLPSSSANTPSAKPPGRGLKILLAVSLALNLAVVGTVAGMALRFHDADRPHPPTVRDLSFGPFTEALTRDQRRAMLRGFAEKGPGLREMRAQMRGDFDAVLTALRATPFEPQAFRSAVSTQSSRIAARAEAGRDALVTLVLQMSDADRAAFVERLEKLLDRRGEKDPRKERKAGN